jgi:hypothetical protein
VGFAALGLGLHLNPNRDELGHGRAKGLQGDGDVFEKINCAQKESL